MAEELENVCMCVENGQPQTKASGEWVLAADGLSFSGEVRNGLVTFTTDQASSVRGKDKFDLTIDPNGYQSATITGPGSILDRPDRLPLPVEVRRLTQREKITLLKERRVLESKFSSYINRIQNGGQIRPPRI